MRNSLVKVHDPIDPCFEGISPGQDKQLMDDVMASCGCNFD